MAINAETVKYTVQGVFKDDITAKSDKAFKQYEKNAKQSMAAVGTAVALIGVAVAAMTLKVVNSADLIGKQAVRLGLTTQELQEMRFAFTLAGVSATLADQSILVFGKRLGKARDETGAMVTGLQKLDNQLLDDLKSSGRMSDALDILFARLERAKSATERLAIADAAFGRGGLQLVSAFAAGGDSFKKARIEARELGVVLNDELIQAAQDTKDEITRMTTVIDSGFSIALSSLFPIINTTTNAIAEMGSAFRVAFGKSVNPIALNLKELKSELKELVDFQKQIQESGEGSFKGNDLVSPTGENADKASKALQTKIDNINKLISARTKQIKIEKKVSKSADELNNSEGSALNDNMDKLSKSVVKAEGRVAELRHELEMLRDGEFMARMEKETKNIAPQFANLRGEARALNAEIRELEDQGRRQTRAAELQSQILSQVVVEPMDLSIQKTQELLALASEFPDVITEAILESGMGQIEDELARATDGINRFEQGAIDAGVAIAFTFEDAILDAKNFGDVISGLAQDLQRVFLRNLVTEPLAEFGGSFLKSLIPAGATTSRQGNVFNNGSVVPFRGGGVVSRPSAFSMGGGIGTIAEEEPEAILPLKRTSSGDLGVMSTPPITKVEINVINNVKADVTTEQNQGPGGDLRLDIIIDELVAEKIRAGGKTRGAIRETFDLNERTIGR